MWQVIQHWNLKRTTNGQIMTGQEMQKVGFRKITLKMFVNIFIVKNSRYFWHFIFWGCFVFLFRQYLTRELTWHKSIFHKALKDGIIAFCYFLFERASVLLWMLSAKQGNQHLFNIFGLSTPIVLCQWLFANYLNSQALK